MLKSSNTEVIEKKVDIEQAMARMRRPLDLTSVNLEVYGVYALPEPWKQKIAENDPTEQSYQYELEVCGMNMKSSKVFARELSEEEKAEQAAAANVKGGAKQPPAPAKDPKKGGGPEEPSKDELERLERERKEKEEKDRKLKEEWDLLDEETKFQRTAEDIYKQPCIKFVNQYAHKKIEQLQAQLGTLQADSEEYKDVQHQISELQTRTYTGHIVSEKQGFEVVEFEEQVIREKGCWVKFMKLPPQEEVPQAAAAAKGAPAKGAPKAGGAVDMKPTYGRAWISFDNLLLPGALETKQRVFLETCPPMVKKAGEDGVERWTQSEEPFENVFEHSRTYIYMKITLTDPVTPTVAAQPEPLPQDVVPVKQFVRWPFSKDPTEDFKKQITLAVESLAKEYYNQFQQELQEEQRNRERSEKQRAEAFEERKKEFLYEINTSGKYHIMKEKMKKTIVRIVKEHFHKQDPQGVKGLYKDERDHFYSQLYAYLVQQMRLTVKDIVQKKKNELHENVAVPQEQFTQERDRLIALESDGQENLSQRYKRLALEYEQLYCNAVEAENYMVKLAALNEGEPEMMLELGKFFLRNGKLDKADQYLRDAYSFNIKNHKLGFMYASYLLQQERNKEAIVILNKLQKDNFEPIQVNLLLSLAYESDQDPLLALKYKSVAFTHRLRELELIGQPGNAREHGKPQAIPSTHKAAQQEGAEITNKVESQPAFGNARLTSQQEDELYLQLADSLSQDSMCIIAQKVIQLVKEQDGSLKFQASLGKILLQKRSYEEALKPFQWILSKDETNLECICNIGHCHFMLKRTKEAEEAYIKSIRVSSFTGQALEDPYVLQRLGSLYIQQGLYGEAQVIFDECYLKYQNSFSHLNYGITLIYNPTNRDFHAALKYLSRANILNPYLGDIWGYIVYASLAVGLDIQAFQAHKEALKLKISKLDLLKDLSQMWIERKRYEEARDTLEMGLRTRQAREGQRYQKKLDEFMKAIEGPIQSNEGELRAKFRDIMVKGNAVKDDDWFLNNYIKVIPLTAAK